MRSGLVYLLGAVAWSVVVAAGVALEVRRLDRRDHDPPD